MGASLGREGAPKQAGAVLASTLSDRAGLSNEQRRLLVACCAGAGMAAAYGVPIPPIAVTGKAILLVMAVDALQRKQIIQPIQKI